MRALGCVPATDAAVPSKLSSEWETGGKLVSANADYQIHLEDDKVWRDGEKEM